MLHVAVDTVLPGLEPEGQPCPDCHVGLPWKAGGFPDAPALFRKPTVEKAVQDARNGKARTLLKHLDPERYAVRHKPVAVSRGSSQERPCRFEGWPSWLLAHCRTPEDVDAWVERLAPWWTPPGPPSGP